MKRDARAIILLAMASVDEHQATIARLEGEKARLVPRLDASLVEFQRQIPGPAAAWMRKEIQRRIEDKAEHIEKIGLPGVKAIKDELEATINDLSNVAARSIGDRSGWPHHRRQEATRIGPEEPFLDRVFRDLISTLGPVLERHQLMDLDGQYGAWERVGGGKWRYRINPGLEPVLPEISSEYSNGLVRLWQIEREFESAKKGLAQARAADLWNRA